MATAGGMISVQKDLQMLLTLQNVDYDLLELERSKDYLPDMIRTLEQQTTEAQENLKSLEKELLEQNLEQKRLELETATARDELSRYQKQMRDIKTNKEYDALMKEIDKRKGTIAADEDLLLTVMGTLEELTEKIEEAKKRQAEVKKTNEEQLVNLKQQLSSIGQKIKMKEDERKNITVRIDRSTFSVYERVRKGKGGHAVVAVRKRACAGCYKSLPPQRVAEIRRGDTLITCDNCGRLLIWTGED